MVNEWLTGCAEAGPCRRPGASSKLENLDGLAVDPSADGLGVNNRLIARRVHQLPANAPARRAPAARHWAARLEAGVPGRAPPVATGPTLFQDERSSAGVAQRAVACA
jgi:hypothetical protein